jgi:hypothetical protein
MPFKKGSDSWRAKAKDWAAYNEDGTGTYADLDKDIRIVVARPFIEHLMHSVVLSVAGRETGATLFGPADSAPIPSSPHSCPRPVDRAPHRRVRVVPAAQCN